MRQRLYASILASLVMVPMVVGQAPNDACTAAIALTCGQTVSGTTTAATLDATAINCGTAVTAPGVWYSIVGTGEAITLSTCPDFGYDTKINVYRGGCAAPICVTGNDDGGTCDVGSTASFPSEAGIAYLILVQGFEGTTGTFDLEVTCGPITNDFCQGAISMTCNSSLSGSTLDATLDPQPFFCETGIQAAGRWYTFTGISDPVVISTCEGSDYDTRVNVYSGGCDGLTCVIGNDDTPGVGTCSTVNFVPDPELQYFILVQGYDGETGNFSLELACQACGTPSEVNATAGDVNAYVFWESLNPGATYTIEYGPLGFQPGEGTLSTGTVNGGDASAVVTGLDSGTEYAYYLQEVCGEGEESLRVGPFTFITLADPPAANAICEGALPIACGGSVDGDTELSFFLPGTTCGAANITAPGLWYSIAGDGSTITLSTCGAANFDTKLSVYTGSCGNLSCVAGGDDAPGCEGNTSEVFFSSIAGNTYYVLVHAYEEQVGTFTLSATCTPTCSPIEANDECANAIAIEPTGIGQCAPTTGDNSCAFATGVENPPCDPYSSIVDIWYSFNSGDQTSFVVSLAALTAEEVSAALYTDCGSIEYVDCEAGIDAPWIVNGLQPQTDYLIRVWNGGGPDAGTFALCIETDLTTSVGSGIATGATAMWPNPTLDQINITGVPSAATAIEILDLQGRSVLSVATNGALRITADVRALAPGTYMVRAAGDAPTTLGRFVKE